METFSLGERQRKGNAATLKPWAEVWPHFNLYMPFLLCKSPQFFFRTVYVHCPAVSAAFFPVSLESDIVGAFK
jgi:hypothetical protein